MPNERISEELCPALLDLVYVHSLAFNALTLLNELTGEDKKTVPDLRRFGYELLDFLDKFKGNEKKQKEYLNGKKLELLGTGETCCTLRASHLVNVLKDTLENYEQKVDSCKDWRIAAPGARPIAEYKSEARELNEEISALEGKYSKSKDDVAKWANHFCVYAEKFKKYSKLEAEIYTHISNIVKYEADGKVRRIRKAGLIIAIVGVIVGAIVGML